MSNNQNLWKEVQQDNRELQTIYPEYRIDCIYITNHSIIQCQPYQFKDYCWITNTSQAYNEKVANHGPKK